MKVTECLMCDNCNIIMEMYRLSSTSMGRYLLPHALLRGDGAMP